MRSQTKAIKDKILVVDDDENTRELLRAILTELAVESYDVSFACDGSEALALFNRNQYALVISDIRMPVMDGMQLLQEIKMIKPSANVIILSAYGQIETYKEAMRLGASEFINKPIRIRELQQIVRHNLKHKSVG